MYTDALFFIKKKNREVELSLHSYLLLYMWIPNASLSILGHLGNGITETKLYILSMGGDPLQYIWNI